MNYNGSNYSKECSTLTSQPFVPCFAKFFAIVDSSDIDSINDKKNKTEYR